MNVPLQDSIGLRIYRELMNREFRSAGEWHRNYGPDALQRAPDPMTMCVCLMRMCPCVVA